MSIFTDKELYPEPQRVYVVYVLLYSNGNERVILHTTLDNVQDTEAAIKTVDVFYLVAMRRAGFSCSQSMVIESFEQRRPAKQEQPPGYVIQTAPVRIGAQSFQMMIHILPVPVEEQ